jgi:uncharacterized protein YbaR (Trm112 family)
MNLEDTDFIGILRCPKTGQRLHWMEGSLVSTDGRFSYSVRNGVCVLLEEEAGENSVEKNK